MDYSEFKTRLTEDLTHILGDTATVKLSGENKEEMIEIRINGLPNGLAASVLHLHDTIEKSGDSYDEAIIHIIEALKCAAEDAPVLYIDYDALEDWEQMKEYIFVRLARKDKAAGYYKYPVCGDMTAVVYLNIEGLVDEDQIPEGGILTAKVTEAFFDMWDKDPHEVFYKALMNTNDAYPLMFEPVDKFIEDVDEDVDYKLKMYLLAGEHERYPETAAAILYPGALDEVSEFIGGDYILIPSSVKEFLVIPLGISDVADKLLGSLVRATNRTMDYKDVLSDKAYWYDSEEKKIKVLGE